MLAPKKMLISQDDSVRLKQSINRVSSRESSAADFDGAASDTYQTVTPNRKLSGQDVLRLQKTVGNQSVMRMLAKGKPKPIQRAPEDDQDQAPDDADKSGAETPDLTLEDEQKLLRAKRVVQRQLDNGLVQRAWTGRRQLGGGGLNSVLGKPWIWRKGGNVANLGGYHEHIFFEDGGAPPDIGHMGKQGLGQDTARVGEYAKAESGLDDAKMRSAIDANSALGQPGKYSLLSNNCQAFVAAVLATYRKMGASPSAEAEPPTSSSVTTEQNANINQEA